MVQQHFSLDGFQEQIVQIDDRQHGIEGVIVLHSTVMGPAAGGCRLWSYPSHRAMLTDAMRLARGMTYKNVLAGLPLGGGKAVFNVTPGVTDKRRLLKLFAGAVEALDGRYITAEDVGTNVIDMQQIRMTTRHVSGITGNGVYGGDPSPWTALTVFRSIEVAAHWALGRPLPGLRIAIQGLGNVGFELCRLLSEAGASLVVSDLDQAKALLAADRFGAQPVSPTEIVNAPVDVFSPCALGGILDDSTISRLRARIVCGAANNQLSHEGCDRLLAARGILFAPDFVVNSGGIISVASEHLREPEKRTAALMDEVAPRLQSILEAAALSASTPMQIAKEMACKTVAERWSSAA